MCLWAIYIFPGSVHIFPSAEKADPLWEYIIRSQTHECGNWDWGPDIPFLGIFVSNFRHFVFAVYCNFMLSHDLFYKGTVQLPEPAKQISPEQLKFEVNIYKKLNVLAPMDPVQFLTLFFFITCIVQRFRDYFQKGSNTFVIPIKNWWVVFDLSYTRSLWYLSGENRLSKDKKNKSRSSKHSLQPFHNCLHFTACFPQSSVVNPYIFISDLYPRISNPELRIRIWIREAN